MAQPINDIFRLALYSPQTKIKERRSLARRLFGRRLKTGAPSKTELLVKLSTWIRATASWSAAVLRRFRKEKQLRAFVDFGFFDPRLSARSARAALVDCVQFIVGRL